MSSSQPDDSAATPWLGIGCVLLSAVGFSAKAVIIKMSYAYEVDAGTLLALRMLFSAPFFVIMALWSGRNAGSGLSRGDLKSVALLGFTGYYLASYLDFLGLVYVTASLERLILFLYPTIVILISAWLLKTRVPRRHVAALALSYGGIAVVFSENLAVGNARHEVAIGSSLVFASAVVYSFFLIYAGKVIAKIGSVRFTAYAMLAAGAVCLVQFIATHRLGALRLPAPVYRLSLLMATISTVIPAWLMSEGIRRIGAHRAAMVASIGPIATIFLGYWFLAEPVTTLQLVGSALVLAGVSVVSARPR